MKTKKISVLTLALAAGLFFILGSCNKDTLKNELNSNESILKASGPSANGSGSFVYNGTTRHFTFHANTMPNGSIQGSGVVNYNGSGNFQVKFSIDCMVINGNSATMSGAVTSSNDEIWPVGTPVSFSVVDNGEGSGSDPDQITLVQQSYDYDCTTWPGLWLNEVSGNIQVKP